MRRAVPAAGLGLLLLLSACAQLRTTWMEFRGSPPPLVEIPAAALPAPDGLRAISGEYRMIPLKWDPLLQGNAGGYLLERAMERAGAFSRLAEIRGRGSISYVDRGSDDAPLGDGETRFYRLRAFAPDGRLSAEASRVVVGTTAPPPDPPEDVRAYSRQPREVPLSWSASPDPTVAGYRVERSPAREGPFEMVAQLEGRHATTYVDSGLGDLRVFYYRVDSTNPDGNAGPPSAPVRGVTKPEPLPPLGLRVSQRRLGANVLEWQPNVETDLVEYRLFRARQGDEPKLVASVPAEARRARDGSVDAGDRVTYTLVAVDRDGLESRPSEAVPVASEGYELSAAVREDGVHLSWNPRREEGFSGARLQRSGWFTRRRSFESETGDYVDRDAVPGRRYRYVAILQRVDASEAPASQPIEVRVPKEADFR
jgi:fibronectin type 3 domain-containing protein